MFHLQAAVRKHRRFLLRLAWTHALTFLEDVVVQNNCLAVCPRS